MSGPGIRVTTRRFILCDNCGQQFGGPDAGEYEMGDAELSQFLINEARDQNWIQVGVGNSEALLCTQRCVRAWLKNWFDRMNSEAPL